MNPSRPSATRAAVMTADPISPDEAGTLPGLFRRRCERTPNGVAYVQFDGASSLWKSCTWAEVARHAERWQDALARDGLAPGERVAVLLKGSVEWVLFDVAAQALGLVVVPLYPRDRPENVASILADSGASLLLVGDAEQWRSLAPLCAGLPSLRRVLCLGDPGDDARGAAPGCRFVGEWLPREAPPQALRATDPRALATIVYTSGTTGRPKGVMLSHRNILANAAAVLQVVPAYREDVFLSFLPLSHAYERTAGYYLPMMAGACVAYGRGPDRLPEDLLEIRPTVLVSVPRIFERMHAQLERLVADRVVAAFGGRLRVTVCGGAPLPAELARSFIVLGVPLLTGYGLTEAAPVVSANRLEDNVPGSAGVPLPGVEVRVAEDGELLVRGPNVMLGYWKLPGESARSVDSAGWLHTGDQASLDDRGRIWIQGRLKDLIVMSTGEKVSPAAVEAALCEDPLVEQALVVGEGKPSLAALLVLNAEEAARLSSGTTPSAASLEDAELRARVLKRCNEGLSAFPAHVRLAEVRLTLEPWTIDDGLVTTTRKLRRETLERRFADEIRQLLERVPRRAERAG